MPDLSRTDRRVLQARQEIEDRPQPSGPSLVYSARELVAATIPHRSPPDDPPEWTRQNGFYTLSVRPGYKTNPRTGERVFVGYPYGVIPRLVLLWIVTRAVRTGRPRIALAGTLNGFLRQVGLSPDTGGGRRSDLRRLRDQLDRLFRATFSFEYETPDRSSWDRLDVAPKGDVLWTVDADESPSWIELGRPFFEAVTAHPVPLDLRAVRALKSSPLALDLYAWVSYRYFGVCRNGRRAVVPWRSLQAQLGANYGTTKNFSQRCRPVLRRLCVLYPRLPLRLVRGGVELRPGGPLIAPAD